MESSAGVADRGSAVGGVEPSGHEATPLRASSSRGLGAAEALAHLRDYLALTKPRIISLLLWTTVTTMLVARPSGLSLATVLWTCLGGYLAAGGAGAINHYIDRDIDARMGRTRGRPIVSGRVRPFHALIFGISLGVLATVQLWITVNALAAVLATIGLLGYVLLYTAWLKPRTPQNIVIGGAAGAMPPLVGWAAATGGLSLEALFPFMVIFLWTPPHFWALALLISDDYERTGIPMLPVVRGQGFTRRRILLYSALMVGFTIVPVATGMLGAFYLAAAAVLGAAFMYGATRLRRQQTSRAALQLYLGSLAYLFLLFAAMAADRVLAA
jgi:protoheme IX farnesyltransferase